LLPELTGWAWHHHPRQLKPARLREYPHVPNGKSGHRLAVGVHRHKNADYADTAADCGLTNSCQTAALASARCQWHNLPGYADALRPSQEYGAPSSPADASQYQTLARRAQWHRTDTDDAAGTVWRSRRPLNAPECSAYATVQAGLPAPRMR